MTEPVVPTFSMGGEAPDPVEEELQGIIDDAPNLEPPEYVDNPNYPYAEGPFPLEKSELDLLNADIASLEIEVAQLQGRMEPVSNAIKQVDVDHEALMRAVTVAVEELSRQKGDFTKELQDLRNSERELSRKLRELGVEKNKLLEAQAAKEKLLTLAKTLQELWMNLPWYEAMKEYQNEDILFILNAWNEGLTGVLNANDTGLGKTFETGASLDLLTELFYRKHERYPRVLWLTAKSLVGQTYREHIKWNSKRRQVVVGMSRLVEGKLYTSIQMGADKKMREFQIDMALQNNAWIITNYDALNTTPRLIDVDWDFLIVDEVQKLKGGANCRSAYCSHDASAAQCGATGLWRKTKQIIDEHKPFLIPLSATPVQNKPRDMWAYLHLFDSFHFPSVNKFEREFCWEDEINGKKVQRCDVERLIKTMKNQVIRRTKKEVGIELPDKITEYDIDVRLPDEDEIYTMIRDKMFVNLESMGDKPLTITALIAQISYLRQANIYTGGITYKYTDLDGVEHSMQLPHTDSSKLSRTMEKIEKLVSEGEQVVIFSTFNKPLEHLVELIDAQGWEFNGSGKIVRAALLRGEENSSGKSDSILADFQQGNVQVLCTNLMAGGVGLNLQKSDQWEGGACNAIVLDCWWNPAVMIQAEDRIHRQGQKDTVFIHYMTNEESVDAFIASILAEKQAMMDGIMERDEIRPAFEWAEILKGLI